MNLGVLALRLRKVNFADKFSDARLFRLSRSCLQSAKSVFLTTV